MPAVVSAGAGLHVEQLQRRVAHDFQNVGVAADEEIGPESLEFGFSGGVVITWIAADVGHKNAQNVAIPGKILRDIGTDLSAVHVAVNCSGRPEAAELFEDFRSAEVARVPDFIAAREM